MSARPAEAFVHGVDGSPVAVVPGRVAAWLVRRLQLDRVRAEIRGQDPEVDAVLVGLTVAGAAWRARTGSAAGTTVAPTSEPAGEYPLSTKDAADRLGLSTRAVTKAAKAGRLGGHQRDGRWYFNPADIEIYRTRG